MLLVSIFHSYLVLSLVGDGLVDLSLVQTYVLFLLIWMLDYSGFMWLSPVVALLCTSLALFSPMIMNHDIGFQCLQPYAAAWTALI